MFAILPIFESLPGLPQQPTFSDIPDGPQSSQFVRRHSCNVPGDHVEAPSWWVSQRSCVSRVVVLLWFASVLLQRSRAPFAFWTPSRTSRRRTHRSCRSQMPWCASVPAPLLPGVPPCVPSSLRPLVSRLALPQDVPWTFPVVASLPWNGLAVSLGLQALLPARPPCVQSCSPLLSSRLSEMPRVWAMISPLSIPFFRWGSVSSVAFAVYSSKTSESPNRLHQSSESLDSFFPLVALLLFIATSAVHRFGKRRALHLCRCLRLELIFHELCYRTPALSSCCRRGHDQTHYQDCDCDDGCEDELHRPELWFHHQSFRTQSVERKLERREVAPMTKPPSHGNSVKNNSWRKTFGHGPEQTISRTRRLHIATPFISTRPWSARSWSNIITGEQILDLASICHHHVRSKFPISTHWSVVDERLQKLDGRGRATDQSRFPLSTRISCYSPSPSSVSVLKYYQ